MQQLVEYICMVIEEKYCVDLKGKWICTREKNLECICLSGEVLNHAISNILLFFKDVSQYNIALKKVDNALCPVVEVAGKQCVSINKKDEGILNLMSIRREVCKNNRDDKFYIKLKVRKEEKCKYKLLLAKVEAEIENQYLNDSSCSGRKYRLLLHTIKRMRILKNRNQLHIALMGIRCFVASAKTLDIIDTYVKSVTDANEDKKILLEFIERYIWFLKELEKCQDTMRVDVFAQIFEKNLCLDISLMLYEYVEENSYLELMEIINISLKDNLQKASLEKWEKVLNKIDGIEYKAQKNNIKANIDYLLERRKIKKNRTRSASDN